MGLFARADVEPLDPSEVNEFVTELRTGLDFQIAIIALLVYDTILTFDKEVKYFWKTPRRPVDFVYFMNRYVGIFGAVMAFFGESFNTTLLLCNFSAWTRNVANWVTIISIDYILMIRVLALFSQEKRLSICLKTLLAVEFVLKLGIVVYLNIFVHLAIAGYADILICILVNLPPWQLAITNSLVPLAYGALLMILALYKAAEYWRMSAGFKGFVLVKVLLEDQIEYFALVLSCSVFSILNFMLEPSSFFLANVLAQLGNPSMLSLLGSRVLLNLKEAGERGQNEGTSYRTPSSTVSSMDFVEPVSAPRESGTELGGSEKTA